MSYHRVILLSNGIRLKIVRISDDNFANDELCQAYIQKSTNNDSSWKILFDTGNGMFSEEELNCKLADEIKKEMSRIHARLIKIENETNDGHSPNYLF